MEMVYEPTENFVECPLNFRRHYYQQKLEQLAESIKSVGILEPLLSRMSRANGTKGALEIIAGTRRFRAAKLADLRELPTIVRDISDAEALEAMVIENNQREDVNALEEAEGYRRLLSRDYSLERLAGRIGRSTKYIYDRVKLLKLIPTAQGLLLREQISAGHAILLARLTREQQTKAISPENADVWRYERTLFYPDDDSEHDSMKFCSVRELEAWVDKHVRFDKKAPVDAMLFPETAEVVKAAAEHKEKIVQISYEYRTEPDAKEGSTERIYHNMSWKRADGRDKTAKTCEKSATGIVVVGPHRGEAFKACVDKDCDVHWAKERRARQRRPADDLKSEERQATQQAKLQQQQERERRERELWEKANPAILKACAEKLKKAKPGQMGEILYRILDRDRVNDAAKILPKWKTAEDLLRLLALSQLIEEASDVWDRNNFKRYAKRIGVNVWDILRVHEVAAEQLRVKTSAKAKNRRRDKKKAA